MVSYLSPAQNPRQPYPGIHIILSIDKLPPLSHICRDTASYPQCQSCNGRFHVPPLHRGRRSFNSMLCTGNVMKAVDRPSPSRSTKRPCFHRAFQIFLLTKSYMGSGHCPTGFPDIWNPASFLYCLFPKPPQICPCHLQRYVQLPLQPP